LRWLALLDAAGVPEPEVGGFVDPGDGGDPIEVDNVWRDARLIVEVDGGDHRSPDIRRKDGERDRRLRAAGWTVLRVTDTDIEHEPEGAIDRVRRALRE
jgi:very-short-patch-repair endonuclease